MVALIKFRMSGPYDHEKRDVELSLKTECGTFKESRSQ